MNLRTLFLLPLLAVPALAAGLKVSVRNAKLKKGPQFYAATVGGVAYGQALETLEEAEGWYRVRAGNVSGWIHRSAVTTKRVKAGGEKTVGSEQTSADEVTLAGKGFNPTEKDYGKALGGADFGAVERMEARAVLEEKVLAFLREGELLPKAGKGKKR